MKTKSEKLHIISDKTPGLENSSFLNQYYSRLYSFLVLAELDGRLSSSSSEAEQLEKDLSLT